MGFDIGRRFKVICRLSLLLASLVIGTPPASAADTRAPMGDDYLAALNAIQTSKERQSLQHLFELAIKEAPGIQAELPNLSEADYAALKARLSGFILNRDKAAYVRPSADFFKALAKIKGTKADRAFFDVYAQTEPDQNAIFPAYIRQQTDYTSCTVFSGSVLTGLYRKWLDFRTTYPDAYATEAQGELDSMDAELQAGTCACENKDQVTAGLTAFVTAFPDLPTAPKLRDRIARIKDGTSHIRFECHSG
jgi:hypothetical protein